MGTFFSVAFFEMSPKYLYIILINFIILQFRRDPFYYKYKLLFVTIDRFCIPSNRAFNILK